MDGPAVDAAVKFAIAHENQAPKDLALAHAAGIGAGEPFEHAHWPLQATFGIERPDHQERLCRRRLGRHPRCGHDVQRDQDVLVDGGWCRVAEGIDSRRHRQGARLHAAGRESLRRSAQSDHHLGAPAAANERLERRALGQARLGRSAGRQARGVGQSTAASARHSLQVQRRACERARAGGAAGVETPAARRVA